MIPGGKPIGSHVKLIDPSNPCTGAALIRLAVIGSSIELFCGTVVLAAAESVKSTTSSVTGISWGIVLSVPWILKSKWLTAELLTLVVNGVPEGAGDTGLDGENEQFGGKVSPATQLNCTGVV